MAPGASTRKGDLGALCFSLLLLTVPVSFVLGATERGMKPDLAATIAIAITTPLFLIGERLWPYYPEWQRSRGDTRTDALYALVLTPPLGALLTTSLSLLFLGTFGPPRRALAHGVWPHTWPILLQALFIGLITDFANYWWHRLSHERPFLWRLHAIHHTVDRVYFLNAYRFHPLDSAISYFVMYGPILALGASIDAIAVYTVFDFLFGSLQHANINVKLGPLNWILAGPELHRWHHAKDPSEGNRNYGNTWIVWDIVFGTRFHPEDRVLGANDAGFADMDRYPKGILGQLAAPFRSLEQPRT